jgi:hypothetical protein
MKKIVVIAVVTAGLLLGVLNATVIRHDDGFGAIRKSEMTFADSYLDIRDWGPVDYAKHPAVAKYVVVNGLNEAGEKGKTIMQRATVDAKETLDAVRTTTGDAADDLKKNLGKLGGSFGETYDQVQEKLKRKTDDEPAEE